MRPPTAMLERPNYHEGVAQRSPGLPDRVGQPWVRVAFSANSERVVQERPWAVLHNAFSVGFPNIGFCPALRI